MNKGDFGQRTLSGKKKQAIIAVAALLLGAAAGWFAHQPVTVGQTKLIRQNSVAHKFINPILLAQLPENTTVPQFQELKKDIAQYVAAALKNKAVTDTSVYFRQLNTDSWIGVNVDDTYAPASLLKVVSMIGFFQTVQQNSSLSASRVTIDSHGIDTNANQGHYPPKDPILLGHTYSMQDLLSHMIVDSDNNAAFSLDQLTTPARLSKIYADLSLPDPGQTTAVDFFSPRMYSRVFRALYNGAYISNADSEQALELLSHSAFTQGLVAGVPAGTVVSHKFGERTIGIQDLDNPADSQNVDELHDCGIIYAPSDPYLLCVMTKGSDFVSLQGVIGDISAMAWKSIQQVDAKK